MMTTKGGIVGTLRPYIIVNDEGLLYIGLHESEEDCWRIFLGWPTVGEVRWHKEHGYRCYAANVIWSRNDEY